MLLVLAHPVVVPMLYSNGQEHSTGVDALRLAMLRTPSGTLTLHDCSCAQSRWLAQGAHEHAAPSLCQLTVMADDPFRAPSGCNQTQWPNV